MISSFPPSAFISNFHLPSISLYQPVLAQISSSFTPFFAISLATFSLALFAPRAFSPPKIKLNLSFALFMRPSTPPRISGRSFKSRGKSLAIFSLALASCGASFGAFLASMLAAFAPPKPAKKPFINASAFLFGSSSAIAFAEPELSPSISSFNA